MQLCSLLKSRKANSGFFEGKKKSLWFWGWGVVVCWFGFLLLEFLFCFVFLVVVFWFGVSFVVVFFFLVSLPMFTVPLLSNQSHLKVSVLTKWFKHFYDRLFCPNSLLNVPSFFFYLNLPLTALLNQGNCSNRNLANRKGLVPAVTLWLANNHQAIFVAEPSQYF